MSAVAAPRAGAGTRSRAGARVRAISLPAPELGVLLALAALLYLWALSRNGYANDYYAAAVRSMAGSWHDFLYGSFDPAGLMTVDKPPLALWIQALSVRAFGYGSLQILVPQALIGVATVGLTYSLVRRPFGRVAGAVAGAALLVTPIAVAMARHNNPDVLLTLCCVGALWATVRALESGRTRWLVLAGVCVGLGFETKMAAALLVVPAIAAAYLWVRPRGGLRSFGQLLWGGLAMVVVGGAWPLLMALTPASSRPWISGSNDNSILDLIVGYNGLGRVAGQQGGPGGTGGMGGGGGGGVFGGGASVLRLLNSSLGGQAGWLLGFALVAGVGLLLATRLRRADARTGWLIAVGGSLATVAVAFSAAQGIFHPYYVEQLAPLAAALVGAGAGLAVDGGRLGRLVGAAAIAGGGVTVSLVLSSSGDDSLTWVRPLLIAAFVLGGGALLLLEAKRWRWVAMLATLAVLAIAPATWAVQTLGHATQSTFPAGGPASASTMGGGGGRGGFGGGGRMGTPPGMNGTTGTTGGQSGTTGTTRGQGGTTGTTATRGAGGGGMFGGNTQNLTAALTYVKAHGGGTIGVSSQSGAASAIIASGASVAGIGGFSGSESAVTVSWLAQVVGDGKVRWVIADSGRSTGMSDGRTGSTTAMAAVQKACTAVSTSSSSSLSGLYDCSGATAKLEALAS